MSYYRTCHNCGAHLDPGETCDCVKNAAPVLTHRNGAEQFDKAASAFIVPRRPGRSQDCESDLMNMIRRSSDPEKAVKIAMEAMISALNNLGCEKGE